MTGSVGTIVAGGGWVGGSRGESDEADKEDEQDQSTWTSYLASAGNMQGPGHVLSYTEGALPIFPPAGRADRRGWRGGALGLQKKRRSTAYIPSRRVSEWHWVVMEAGPWAYKRGGCITSRRLVGWWVVKPFHFSLLFFSLTCCCSFFALNRQQIDTRPYRLIVGACAPPRGAQRLYLTEIGRLV